MNVFAGFDDQMEMIRHYRRRQELPLTIRGGFSKLIEDHASLFLIQQNRRALQEFTCGLTKPRDVFVHGGFGNIMKRPWSRSILDATDEPALITG
jgi:hypothetical protein